MHRRHPLFADDKRQPAPGAQARASVTRVAAVPRFGPCHILPPRAVGPNFGTALFGIVLSLTLGFRLISGYPYETLTLESLNFWWWLGRTVEPAVFSGVWVFFLMAWASFRLPQCVRWTSTGRSARKTRCLGSRARPVRLARHPPELKRSCGLVRWHSHPKSSCSRRRVADHRELLGSRTGPRKEALCGISHAESGDQLAPGHCARKRTRREVDAGPSRAL